MGWWVWVVFLKCLKKVRKTVNPEKYNVATGFHLALCTVFFGFDGFNGVLLYITCSDLDSEVLGRCWDKPRSSKFLYLTKKRWRGLERLKKLACHGFESVTGGEKSGQGKWINIAPLIPLLLWPPTIPVELLRSQWYKAPVILVKCFCVNVFV